MKLYGSYTSPYVRHCRVAMLAADLDFEFVETDYAESASKSPTQRVPFFEIDGKLLTDSTSILRWLREQGGGIFLQDLGAFDRYLMANTAMDATVNLFLLERDGLQADDVPYLGRQRDRIRSSLEALDRQFADAPPDDDDGLRLACYLSWAAFRGRVDPTPYEALAGVVKHWETDPNFAATHPSRAG